MHGPEPIGFWSSLTAPNCGPDHLSLKGGQRYRVIQAFTDFDGDTHPVGEEWTFRGHCFLPYEDGLSWFVSLTGDEAQEWHIRMQWREDQQGPVIDNLDQYVERTG
jgi:hypothetical protein